MNESLRPRMRNLIPRSVRGLSAALQVMREQARLAVWAVMGLLVPAAITVCVILLWKYGRNRKPI